MAFSRNALEDNNCNVNILIVTRNWLFILFDGEQRAFYWKYFNSLYKYRYGLLRKWFLNECLKNGIVPNFLSFKVPQNGAFNNDETYKYQLTLLRRQIDECENCNQQHEQHLNTLRVSCSTVFSKYKLMAIRSIFILLRSLMKVKREQLSKKLKTLSQRQDRPIFDVHDSIKNISDITLPEMVNDVLSRGPKYAILTPFDKMGFYKDVDKIIQSKSSDICTKVTAATLSYADNPCNKKFDQRIKQ